MINDYLTTDVVEYNSYKIKVTDFRTKVVSWGKNNFRSFPWRLTTNPYEILVAEVMLKRTQARQVLPVYSKFLEQYPLLLSLKNISILELQKALGPLGLHYRVKMFYEMVEVLFEKFGGTVPESQEDLLSLPGVSYYVAGAVRCFAWNYPVPLIDTNTMRIACRLFGKPAKDSLRRNKKFIDLFKILVDPESPVTYNYSLLDLADKICLKKKAPKCSSCPIMDICYSYKNYSFKSQ